MVWNGNVSSMLRDDKEVHFDLILCQFRLSLALTGILTDRATRVYPFVCSFPKDILWTSHPSPCFEKIRAKVTDKITRRWKRGGEC